MKDLDSRLRTLARAEETPLPEGFEARLGETLSALPERRRGGRPLRTAILAACVCLALAATFALALTPLAVGFTLSSLGAREELLNGVGNLLGMLMTFLGGAWMPLSLMGSAVQTVAHFVPTYWVNDAIGKALASDLTSTVLGDIACDLGVTALFAVAITAVGLALLRTKSRA